MAEVAAATMTMSLLLRDLRRYAVARSLFPPTTLKRAIAKLGFVQADPIRAPARAQDLTLRHRVTNYRAGDLERRYASLGIEEDIFINYGFVPRPVFALMHPRADLSHYSPPTRKTVEALLAFVGEHGEVHPREADAHFAHGRVTNYWGGSSSATTHLLVDMHYRGLLRVSRRDRGVRVYAAHEHAAGPGNAPSRAAHLDALVDVLVNTYAPLPGPSLSFTIGRLRYAVPQWHRDIKAALARATRRLARGRVEGVDWYWPEAERVPSDDPADVVRLLAPFDPVVWDRRRFELLWGWRYRFEAYTPPAQRQRGYYALPMLWRDRIVGWANATVKEGQLIAEVGYVAGRRPAGRAFARALDAEVERMRTFLRIE
ncbi:MAG: hypothetical protein JWL71_1268 [Acidobacteria bacterium]|nr:hypothetical protein [Acidobacteriota bacterium]